jgi:hypothetical protein
VTAQKTPGQRAQRVLPFAVAGLGVVAGILFAIFLVSRSDPATGQASPSAAASTSLIPSAVPSLAASAAPSSEATAAPVPSASPPPSGPARLTWTAGRAQPGTVSSVIRFDDRWIAGGSLRVGPTSRAVVWTSVDGITWSEPIVLGPEPVESEGFWPRYWINGFGEWEGGVLAFGWNGIGCCDGGYPMLWRSSNGDTWEVVETGGTEFGEEYHSPVTSVIGPDGSLVVFSFTGLGGGAATFMTSDLESWETHTIAADGYPPTSMAGSPTHLLAVGHEQPSYSDPDDRPPVIPHAWTSTDGRSWDEVAAPNGAVAFTDIAWDPTHGRFIAVGTDAAGLPMAWLTADGSRWTPIALGHEPVYMHRVVVADGLIVATGETGDGSTPDSADTVVWSSHDGLSWWYATVLEGRVGHVEAATSESAVLVSGRWTESDGESWLSLAGALTPIE